MENCGSNRVKLKGVYCAEVNDSLYCWPATPANQTIYVPCSYILASEHYYYSHHVAFRTCLADGTWLANWTNYSACLSVQTSTNTSSDDAFSSSDPGNGSHVLVHVLKDIMIITTSMSLAFLLIALFIFSYFRSLQCSRNSIHKNLVGSFIFRFVLVMVLFQPHISGAGPSYRDLDWLCKSFQGLHQYFQMANFAWMLVEGIYLHNRLVVTVFPSAAPFKLFYFIGWGIPLIITSVWAGLMQRYHKVQCWKGYARTHLVLILAIPIILALMVNSAFLVNIIRVLVVKLRSNNLVESRRIRKAIKATVVLLPLLGVANLLFLAQPVKDGTVVMSVYRVINGILPSLQGVFVSVLYCFMNSEVQSVIMKKWKRFRTNRAMNTRSRRQGSRTSSYFLSQTDAPRRLTSLNQPYISKARDYHSLATIHLTQEKEVRNGHSSCTTSVRFMKTTVSLESPRVSEVESTVVLHTTAPGFDGKETDVMV
ncbi:hypothetical protein BsWGS_01090 [Bradybaena similaris]